MKSRKTDKWRLKEKRGQGYGENYKPWILVHEVPSDGRSHKIYGWKHNRTYHFLSDGEFYVFLRLQKEDNVLDIREQFPLLPLQDTLDIAEKNGICHPPITKSDNKDKNILTSDLNILVSNGSEVKEIVRTVKTEDDLKKTRTQEKLFIEKEYWTKKGIDWGIILHTEESKVIGKNIYQIYQDYFWTEDKNLTDEELNWLVDRFKDMLIKNDMEIHKTTQTFEKSLEWREGEGLNFFKFLLAHKIIKTDFTVKFNYFDMKIWF
ncbi:MAG: TnsA endonuclease N-terminal domain-containing protein [Ruminiclostridium sp.]